MIKENKVYIMESAEIVGDVKIGENWIIAAGTLVADNEKISTRFLVLGIPGKIGSETNDDIKRIGNAVRDYLRLLKSHYKGRYTKNH